MSPRILAVVGQLFAALCLSSSAPIGSAAEPSGAVQPRAAGQIQYEPQKKTAVHAALDWLAEHQSADGGWNFDHRLGKCDQRCRNHGTLANARIAATSLALLPFLGAGQTSTEGAYKAVVKDGLDFLISKMKVEEDRLGDLTEPGGTMYSQGLAALVLSEAYGMTADPKLKKPAQQALNFIVAAQDPIGGGWRYLPKQPGDTSVFGWQLMALKSGRLAGLEVPLATIKLSGKFLDGVQAEEGSQYGYTQPATNKGSTTAIGLLGRIYSGWDRERPPVVAGVKILSERGPAKSDVYYNFFGTMLMRYCEGESWRKWNSVSRDQLLKSQDKTAHEEGSWYFDGNDPGAKAGGRLYCTAMATMCMDIYYRHLPVYGKAAYQDDFGLGEQK